MFQLIANVLSFLDLSSILFGSIVFLASAYYVLTREIKGLPPGPKFLPIIGNMLDIRGKNLKCKHTYFSILKEQYGSVFRLYFGSQLMIVLNDLDSIDEAFVKQKDVFSIRPTDKLWAIHMSVKNGPGIIWGNDQLWKSSRRMAIQTLRDLGVGKSSLEQRIQEEVDFLLNEFDESKPIVFRDIILRATTNIISIVVFGKRYQYDDAELQDILQVIEAGLQSEGPFSPIHEFPMLRFIPGVGSKLLIIQRSIARLRAFIEKHIKEHKQTFTKGITNDFIDMVLHNVDDAETGSLNEANMKRTILDLFFAGSDTTSNTLDWAFLYMMLNPQILKRCEQEVDDVVGSDRPVNMSDRPNMPFVAATLLEVQRLGNTAPFSLPHSATRDTTVNGYLIPKGSLVYANLYACHLDQKYWDQPLKFNPDRFIGSDGQLIKQPPAFMPFSVGPRICPGEVLARMELFLFFTNIIQRYHISKPEGCELSTKGIHGVTLSPPSHTMIVTPRQK